MLYINRAEIFKLIEEERERQEKMHPTAEFKNDNGSDVEVMHNFILTNEFLSVLVEEIGEVAKALQGEGSIEDELIHVASVCVRWLEYRK